MADEIDPPALRLAFRTEGKLWVVYMARPGTMKGALPLGSILMSLVAENPERRREVIELFKAAMSDALGAVVGEEPTSWTEEVAAESERTDNA